MLVRSGSFQLTSGTMGRELGKSGAGNQSMLRVVQVALFKTLMEEAGGQGNKEKVNRWKLGPIRGRQSDEGQGREPETSGKRMSKERNGREMGSCVSTETKVGVVGR